MKSQNAKFAPAKLSGRSKIEVHDASPEATATVRNLIRDVVDNADTFLEVAADPLDVDLVSKGRQDIVVYADVLLRVIGSLTESQPELAALAFQCLAAVLQGVRLVACHAGQPASAIRHGVKLGDYIKGAELRKKREGKISSSKRARAEAYKAAVAFIKARDEKVTVERTVEVMDTPGGPHFFPTSRGTIKNLRKEYRCG